MSYVFFGGMRGTAWVNTLQTLMFLAFGLLALAVVGAGMGGFGPAIRDMLATPAQASLLTRERFSPWISSATRSFRSHRSRFHTSASSASRRAGCRTSGARSCSTVCMILIWLPCVFLGLLANRATEVPAIAAKLEARATLAEAGPTLQAEERDRLRRAASGDDVMLRLVEHYAPIWLVGLLGASVMAAVMASDSQILALSTMFTEDVFTYYEGTAKFGERVQVVTGRVFVVVLTLVAYLIAIRVPQSIFDLASQYAFAGYAALCPLLVAALFWRGSTKWGALAVVVWVAAGVGAIALVQSIVPTPAGPPTVLWQLGSLPVITRGAGGLTVLNLLPVVPLTLGSIVLMWLVSALTPKPSSATLAKVLLTPDPARWRCHPDA